MDPLDPTYGARADPLTATFEQQQQQQQQQQNQHNHNLPTSYVDPTTTSNTTTLNTTTTAGGLQQQQQQHQPRFNYIPSGTWPFPSPPNFDMPAQHQQQQQQQANSQHNSHMDSTSRDQQNHNASTAMNQRALTIATTTPPLHSDIGLGYAQAMMANTTPAEWQQFDLPVATTTAAAAAAMYTNNFMDGTFGGSFGGPLQNSPIDFISAAQGHHQLNNSLAAIDPSQPWAITTSMDQPMPNPMAFNMGTMTGFGANFTQFPITTTDPPPSSIASQSPGEQWQDYSSSNPSDGGWTMINYPGSARSFDFSDIPVSTVVSPQALHIRTDSSSSDNSDLPLSAHSCGSAYEEIFPMTSPEPDVEPKSSYIHSPHSIAAQAIPIHPHSINTNFAQPRAIASSSASSPSSGSGSGSGSGSPSTSRRKKSPVGVSGKVIGKKKATDAKDKAQKERRVGRRRGPLRPDQRQQAHEIRKVGACLRCKYLKKTCDKGDPCAGCQPSHHRLWQVPCTRIDIKDIGYFFKDWTADYERHVTLGFSIANIKGFSLSERKLSISHGYGFDFPLMAREVYVRDEKVFGCDWIETLHLKPTPYEVQTNKLTTGASGVSNLVLSEYLERYVDFGFDPFVDQYFEGTPFLTEILKTAHRYWAKTKLPVLRKGLKLVVAYALTLHITMVNGLSEDEMRMGRIDDDTSRWFGATIAPVMINFEIKKALAEMWRELMKDILEELSSLYSSVYSGEKLRHWPTIFMLASLLLAVWEMMQFDCRYRVPDEAAVDKFCKDMESTPVGVIVGLFQAISTKLPTFAEWDTTKHAQMLNNVPAVCDALTEVREHVTKYEQYLKTRNEAEFDRGDFDSLSNKFLSKLVIRAGAS